MTEPARRRLSLPAGWSLPLALGVPVLVLSVLAIGYYRYIHYQRVAVTHVPVGAYFAVRIDLEQVVLFEPFRKHLLPVLNQVRGGDESPTRIARIEQALGVKLGMDTREVVLAYGPEESQWTLIVGGLFPHKGALVALEQAFQSDAQLSTRLTSDGVSLEIQPWQIFVAQAQDGAIVVASSDAQVRAALASSDAFAQLGLQQQGPGSFGFTLGLHGVDRVSGSLELGDVVTAKISATLDSQSATQQDSAAQRASATSLLDAARAFAATDAGCGALSLREVLARAKISSTSGNQVQFQSFWQLEEIDHAAENLGTTLAGMLQ